MNDATVRRKSLLKWVGRLGAAYFAVCLLAWAAVLALALWPSWRHGHMPEADGVDWPMFLHALPTLALTAGFAMAVRSLRGDTQRTIWLLAIATLGTITFAVVEIGFGFYNMRLGERNVYLNWLWYIEKVGPERGDALVYGYIDPNGEVVIPPRLGQANPFREGLAAVQEGGLYGFVDKSGAYVIEPQFQYADGFSEGMARVVLDKWGKDGYINRSGELIVPPRFTTARRFSEGLAAVRDEQGRWGYIDKSGDYVIEPEWMETHTFSGGLGLAEKDDVLFVIRRSDLSIAEVETKGYTSWTRPFTEGLAPVQIGFSWGYVDGDGRFAISPQYEWAFNFHDGLALVETKDGFGYIDKSGRFVIGPLKAKQGLTSLVIGPMTASAGSFSEGLVPLTTNNGKWGYRARWRTDYCDRNGRTVITTDFMQAQAFSDELAAVRSVSGKWGYINKRGNVVISPQFVSAGPFSEGLACVGVRL
jgi:hypothetical protein